MAQRAQNNEFVENDIEKYGEKDCSVVVVHSSLGQRLIRHEWEAFLPDVGLSKTLRTKAQRHF